MQTIYEAIGGEAKVRELVEVFYDHMERAPEAAEILALHPRNLASSREKLFLFLSGWMGGPQLYIEAYGHPRLRARHLPFPIGDAEAAAWMACMEVALERVVTDAELAENLKRSFTGVALHMRNRAD